MTATLPLPNREAAAKKASSALQTSHPTSEAHHQEKVPSGPRKVQFAISAPTNRAPRHQKPFILLLSRSQFMRHKRIIGHTQCSKRNTHWEQITMEEKQIEPRVSTLINWRPGHQMQNQWVALGRGRQVTNMLIFHIKHVEDGPDLRQSACLNRASFSAWLGYW